METRQESEKKLELRSQDVQDVLGKVPPSILRWGITVIALILIGLLAGAYFFKYPDTLTGQVSITTSNSDHETTPTCTMLLPAMGSGKVKVGQRALVRIINFPDHEFGYLEGRVEHLSNIPNADGNFAVKIHLPKGLVTNYGFQLPKNIQMQGSADIIIEDKRLLYRLFPIIQEVPLK